MMHRATIGDFELTVLSDGTYKLDGGAMFGVIPKVMWGRRIKADEANRITMGLNSLLIRGGKQTVLVETGAGPKLDEKQREIFENQAALLRSFEQAGVSPEEIDIVINTHLHFDHCGYNTYYKDGKAVPTFPRARYYAPEGEVLHGRTRNPRDYVSYIPDNYEGLIADGRMELLKGAREIAPGISVEPFPGHTRAMMGVTIRSAGKTACYISDLIPTTHHIDLVWGMGYDLFPLEVIDNRRRFYEHAVPEQWLVVFTHDHETPLAYIEPGKSQGKYIARPAGASVMHSG
jgi:glyoxylase-like metal-dependent hydrolase (beta-lactamase superfamily II)